jgi:hypothetical protein
MPETVNFRKRLRTRKIAPEGGKKTLCGSLLSRPGASPCVVFTGFGRAIREACREDGKITCVGRARAGREIYICAQKKTPVTKATGVHFFARKKLIC